jgi:hypothetical protein
MMYHSIKPNTDACNYIFKRSLRSRACCNRAENICGDAIM